MIVYRIGKTRYARDLSGEGARLNGGRWNHKLTACLYSSESRALAVLEYTVNVNIDEIPRALSITSIEIPDAAIAEMSVADLPGNWMETPALSSTKDFGTKVLKTAISPVIKIPSTVIPEEFNYLLNPMHPGSKGFKIAGVRDFVFDVRIKLT
jgi:RES domain-containing protein